ncbi:MAG: NAD(+)/NADH kinase [Caldilineales bacterium]|nr:NAD(+)/NADH kinase [Caldilineales bacterium]
MSLSPRYIHVVINPASGQPEPVLSALNGVFHPAGIRWDVSITAAADDARRFARQAVANGADVVAAYGGDGTQMEVAQGLRGSDVPLLVLPGGTANLLSVELGIPKKLAEAARLAVDENSATRAVDMGHAVVGDADEHEFILRVGIGFEGLKIEKADREMKDKYGEFAYTIGGIEALYDAKAAKYHATLDGVEYEAEAVNVIVANAGTIGVKGVTRWKEIDVSDGQLDVLAVKSKGLKPLTAAFAEMAGRTKKSKTRPRAHAREIYLVADPPQPINGDGEIWGHTPIRIKVIPAAVQIIVPR